MSGGTLYTYHDNFRAFKALIAAQYSGAKVKVVSDPPEFVIGETNKSEEFLKKFPLGKVPAFQGNDGTLLFKSNAIAYFVANEVLRGLNVSDAACIQQWLDFADNDILPAYCTWIFPIIGILQYNKQNTDKAKEDIKFALGVLNQHLAGRTYLVGERITLADICVACHLLTLYQKVLEPEFRKPFVNTNRWFVTMVNQPEFKAVVGDVHLCVKAAHPDNKAHHVQHGPVHHGHHGHGHGHQPKKQEKPSAHQEKQEKPKEKLQEKAKDQEEEDENEFAEKPTSDPFAALPKGSFNMDEFKRVYSNNDTKKVALPYFWEKFEKDNYSIWFCEYKYPEELKLIFMSCNLVSGMFQRLDRMRKHSFGSMIVFGEDNKNTISGVWFWRGQDLAFKLADDLQIDYESYTWKKLDPSSEETKKLVEEYFSWEGHFEGKKFNQGKIFK
ncbi:hypothetical protein HELRODRAFT_105304 [Helobdella robusta]|uniref:Elongation factor 1-gamma n=1 Tax=Helobdella robusta TaxID=6412 RepID=T1EDT6_HELRO|nr:hypothetical protein HELRODRAFT_105304 [Helobdella robusta]ESO12389.1 hypothetical protein HELRODRAFT_105304 [Helobdella robusta]